MARRVLAEGLGTGLLLAVVVGSGIMGERLADGAIGLALLVNSLATAAGLAALIIIFGPISGAHFNPAVTLVLALRGHIRGLEAVGFIAAQLAGAAAGVWLAHGMFDEPLVQLSSRARDGFALALSEGVATFGLLATVLACVRYRPEAAPYAVGLYIFSACWFTASTSFANPAVTVARALSDSFAGIAPASVPAFLAAQIAGALLALATMGWMMDKEKPV